MRSPPRALVLGATGMLGRVAVSALSSAGFQVTAAQRRNRSQPAYFEILSSGRGIGELISETKCAVVINCVAALASPLQDTDEAARAEAVFLNAFFPLILTQEAARYGARVVLISTDAVFSGRRSAKYTERDRPDATDVYGQTKALGESPAENALTIRCSLIGVDAETGRGLVEWFLHIAEGDVVRGFEDQRWNGVTTLQLAEVITMISVEATFDVLRHKSPVYHFCPNDATTKYALLRDLNALTGNKRNVIPATSQSSNSGRLLASMFADFSSLVPAGRPWPELLAELLSTR